MDQIQSNFAVIDIGTNTFHLLIAYLNEDKKLIVLYRKRVYVFLGRGGVEEIDDKAYQLGLKSLNEFSRTISKFNVVATKTLGTSALRNANNGPQFITAAKESSGIDIDVIDGDMEAQLIYQGVQLAKTEDDKTHLIMDIGGGSVEFIIFNSDGKLWSKSFKIGISILHPKFQKNDPLSQSDKDDISSYLNDQLAELKKALEGHEIESLIGASGSFEVLQSMSGFESKPSCTVIPLEVHHKISKIIMSLGLDNRLALSRLDNDRAVLAQIAFYLIDVILDWSKAKQILVSPYAMKEGALMSLSN